MAANVIQIGRPAQARPKTLHHEPAQLPYETAEPPNGYPVGSRPPGWVSKPKRSKGTKHAALDAAICDSGLPSTQRLVLFALNRRNGWTARKGRPPGTCYVSIARIAHDTGRDPRTVQRTLGALVRAGWLVVERVPEHRTNLYRITPPQTPTPGTGPWIAR